MLAASYEARAYGVHAGMPGWSARRACPDIVFVGGHFGEYQRLGDSAVSIFNDFTPLVERVSIDEAFLDVSGALHLFGQPREIAESIRQRVRSEIGLPLSVGVARTKHLAKVASQVAKPDGVVVVEPEDERAFLDPLPVRLVWGVGPATESRLAASGIRTIGELGLTGSETLEQLLARAAGGKLSSLAANIDDRGVEAPRRARSVGAQAALGRRRATPDLARETLGYLADRVGGRLRAGGLAGRTVTVRVRFADLRAITRTMTVPVAISSTLTLTEVAMDLQAAALADNPDEHEVSLLGLSVSKLVEESALQLELPVQVGEDRHRPGLPRASARWGVDRSVDAIRAKFGSASVGYATVVFSETSRVPEEFRELAEKPRP